MLHKNKNRYPAIIARWRPDHLKPPEKKKLPDPCINKSTEMNNIFLVTRP